MLVILRILLYLFAGWMYLVCTTAVVGDLVFGRPSLGTGELMLGVFMATVSLILAPRLRGTSPSSSPRRPSAGRLSAGGDAAQSSHGSS